MARQPPGDSWTARDGRARSREVRDARRIPGDADRDRRQLTQWEERAVKDGGAPRPGWHRARGAGATDCRPARSAAARPVRLRSLPARQRRDRWRNPLRARERSGRCCAPRRGHVRCVPPSPRPARPRPTRTSGREAGRRPRRRGRGGRSASAASAGD